MATKKRKQNHMTPRVKRFINEYLIDLNASQAALRAGYSMKTCGQIGYQLLQKTLIQTAINERRAKLAEKLEITQERVLQELARIAFSDPRKLFAADGSLKNPLDMDDNTAGAFAGMTVVESAGPLKPGKKGAAATREPEFTKTVKLWDKNVALKELYRHVFPEDAPKPPQVVNNQYVQVLNSIGEGGVRAIGAYVADFATRTRELAALPEAG